MTTISKVTPQSAPRDTVGLEKLGIFQLRLLIEACGGLHTDEQKVAFSRMKVEEKVTLAQQLLGEFDKKVGTNGTNGAAAPAPLAMAPPMGVAQVDPAAVAAAAAAATPVAPPAAAKSKREPRTSADAGAQADGNLGSAIIEGINKILAQSEANTSNFKEVIAAIQAEAKANAQHAENYKAVYGALQAMNGGIQQAQMLSKLAMALVLPLAEQTLGASREEILGATIGDIDSISRFIQQAQTPGKG